MCCSGLDQMLNGYFDGCWTIRAKFLCFNYFSILQKDVCWWAINAIFFPGEFFMIIQIHPQHHEFSSERSFWAFQIRHSLFALLVPHLIKVNDNKFVARIFDLLIEICWVFDILICSWNEKGIIFIKRKLMIWNDLLQVK